MSALLTLNGKKVYLVEDDLFFVKLISERLVATDCIFQYTDKGEKAVSEIPIVKPDIILLDLLLPGGTDGFEVLKKIKDDEKTKGIPVVILSNLSGAEDVERGMKLGAFRYLVKATVSLDDVIDNLESALTSKVK